MILDAMTFLQEQTCVKFVHANQKDKKDHRIVVTGLRGDLCQSWIGYQPDLKDKETKRLKKKLGFKSLQSVVLGNGCLDKYTIQHELLHALGLHHEQSRYDRDDYVQIMWDNIESGTHLPNGSLVTVREPN